MADKNAKNLLMTDEIRVSGIRSGGFGQLPKIVMLDPDLSAEAKGIYAYFASYTGGGNSKAFPGRDKIVHDLGITKDTYYKHFKSLTAQGYISVVQTNGGISGKGFSHNIYTLESFPEKYHVLPAEGGEKYLSSRKLVLEAADLSAAGYGNVPKSVMSDTTLPLVAKAIYAYLCVFSGENFKAAPSKQVAVYHMGISGNSFSKYAKILEDAGYITRVQSQTGGQFGSVVYTLVQNPKMMRENEEKDEDLPYTKFSDTIISYPIESDTEVSDSVIPDTKKSDSVLSDSKISDTITTSVSSKTNQNKNNSDHNQSIHLAKAVNAQEEDGLTDSEREIFVLDVLGNEGCLTESILFNPKKLDTAVTILCGSAENTAQMHAVSALRDLLNPSSPPIRLAGNEITPDMVRSGVNTVLDSATDLKGALSDIVVLAADRFARYSARGTIASPDAYLKSVIVTELNNAVLMTSVKDAETDKEESHPLPTSIIRKT